MSPDEVRMSCLQMAIEVSRQTPDTDVVSLAERFLNFLTDSMTPDFDDETQSKRFPHFRGIIEDVAQKHGVKVGEILGGRRAAHIIAARYEAIRKVADSH